VMCPCRYALGLIYANHGSEIRPFLLESLRGTSNEVIQHGACLGLGGCMIDVNRAGCAACCSTWLLADVCAPACHGCLPVVLISLPSAL
jgi:hypothetical protein